MLTLFIPFITFVTSFFARFLGNRAASYLIIFSITLSWILSILMIKKVCLEEIIYSYQINWLQIYTFDLKFSFHFDSLSTIMTLLITTITLLVMIYSYSYLGEDPSIIRFLAYLSFFCFTMLTMVTSGNYVQFFIGWEGVGLASYLLISFWTTRNEANLSGLKAVIINRIGDVFFMFALGLMWTLFRSFDYGIIFSTFPAIVDENNIIIADTDIISLSSLLAFCLCVAAFAKSAQLLLHTWLPDAMEGPTPVSSLLHSATMVTAGVYLIIRSSFIFSFMPYLSNIMAFISIVTVIVSSLIGLYAHDLKKIIAYSTCSQLGFMLYSCSLGFYNFAFFHLVTHAMFKCLLFLCSGSIIHALSDEQDLRKMGYLLPFLPLTFTCMLIGTLALTGFPMLSGFFSKDLLLETAYSSSSYGIFIFSIATFAAFLTSFYSFRSFYLIFYSNLSSVFKSSFSIISEAPLLMLISMVTLTVLGIISGCLLEDVFVGLSGLFFWNHSIFYPLFIIITESEYINLTLKLLPTFASILGGIFSIYYLTTAYFFVILTYFYRAITLVYNKFHFDSFYNLIAKSSTFFAYNVQYIIIDRGLLELFATTGAVRTIKVFYDLFTFIHSGSMIKSFAIIISATSLIIYINYFFLFN